MPPETAPRRVPVEREADGRTDESRRVRRILDGLAALYPDARCELHYETPFQLLVATMLSAQSTDAKVNQVTPELFRRYPDARAFAALTPEELAPHIQSIGLYRTKSKNIIETARILVERFGGEVPRDFDALVALPGVGRKTANVVLSTAFGLPAIAVDTHVFRVGRRLGLASGDTPERVEAELRQRIPMSEWAVPHHRLIWHGRRMCHARAPKCDRCPLWVDCPHGLKAARSGQKNQDPPVDNIGRVD
ncbi:endonuclease III [Hydrogenibacillus schlegelii]|uniref:endonuclease III n=1 Tax=Hydrogenibacillus schlegelii TaxID=1484 RepID=UPI0009E876F4|nr:endonuclease III [Hydrogenibacillus schlegelii]